MSARQAGFTLLEILVALAVLGFLLVGLSEGVRFGLRAWDSENRLVASHADTDAVERLLRELIEQTDPGDAAAQANADQASPADPMPFKGEAHLVSFATRLPMTTPGVTREAKVALGVDQKHRLVLRFSPAPHAVRLAPAPPPAETVLMEGVDHIDVKYQRWPTEGGGWVSVWSAPKPPMLVDLKIGFVKDDKRHWPDIIVAPMRTQPEQ